MNPFFLECTCEITPGPELHGKCFWVLLFIVDIQKELSQHSKGGTLIFYPVSEKEVSSDYPSDLDNDIGPS